MVLNEKNPHVLRRIDDLSCTIATSTCIFVGIGTKFIGYRVILYIASFVGVVVTVKWLMWTNNAKRQAFLQQVCCTSIQFVFYAKKRLLRSFRMISSQNEKMTERTLKQALSEARFVINLYLEKLEDDIAFARKEVTKIDDIITKCSSMR